MARPLSSSFDRPVVPGVSWPRGGRPSRRCRRRRPPWRSAGGRTTPVRARHGPRTTTTYEEGAAACIDVDQAATAPRPLGAAANRNARFCPLRALLLPSVVFRCTPGVVLASRSPRPPKGTSVVSPSASAQALRPVGALRCTPANGFLAPTFFGAKNVFEPAADAADTAASGADPGRPATFRARQDDLLVSRWGKLTRRFCRGPRCSWQAPQLVASQRALAGHDAGDLCGVRYVADRSGGPAACPSPGR